MKFTVEQTPALAISAVSVLLFMYLVRKMRKLTVLPAPPKDNSRLFFWLAAFKYFSGVTKVGCMGFLGGTVNMHLAPWATVSIASYVAMMTFTEQFVEQVAGRIAAGKPPIGTNGTSSLTREQAQVYEKLPSTPTPPKP